MVMLFWVLRRVIWMLEINIYRKTVKNVNLEVLVLSGFQQFGLVFKQILGFIKTE